MNISCVHRDIPQDLTLAAEESSHLPLPYGSSYHQSVKDPNPVPSMPSLDLRLVSTKIRNRL
jgi:hypothetical protein